MHPICFWSNWGQILLILYASREWTLVLQIVHYWAAHEGNGQLRNKKQFLSMSRKDKMADGTPRRLCMSHSPFSGANFCREGTGHFRSSFGMINTKLLSQWTPTIWKACFLKPCCGYYQYIEETNWQIIVLFHSLVALYSIHDTLWHDPSRPD